MSRKFYYCPLAEQFLSDRALKETRKKFVRARRRGPHAIEVVYGAGGLQYAGPGDTVYINAHGAQDDAGVVGTKKTTISVSQVATRLINDGLGDGTAENPLLIKCLVCYSGGHLPHEDHTTGALFETGKTRTRYTGSREFTDLPARSTAHLAQGCFARRLAIELRAHGLLYILVGGYPGRIVAFRGRVFSGVYRVHCVWFDCWGNAAIRAPSADRADYEFQYVSNHIAGNPGWIG